MSRGNAGRANAYPRGQRNERRRRRHRRRGRQHRQGGCWGDGRYARDGREDSSATRRRCGRHDDTGGRGSAWDSQRCADRLREARDGRQRRGSDRRERRQRRERLSASGRGRRRLRRGQQHCHDGTARSALVLSIERRHRVHVGRGWRQIGRVGERRQIGLIDRPHERVRRETPRRAVDAITNGEGTGRAPGDRDRAGGRPRDENIGRRA